MSNPNRNVYLTGYFRKDTQFLTPNGYKSFMDFADGSGNPVDGTPVDIIDKDGNTQHGTIIYGYEAMMYKVILKKELYQETTEETYTAYCGNTNLPRVLKVVEDDIDIKDFDPGIMIYHRYIKHFIPEISVGSYVHPTFETFEFYCDASQRFFIPDYNVFFLKDDTEENDITIDYDETNTYALELQALHHAPVWDDTGEIKKHDKPVSFVKIESSDSSTTYKMIQYLEEKGQVIYDKESCLSTGRWQEVRFLYEGNHLLSTTDGSEWYVHNILADTGTERHQYQIKLDKPGSILIGSNDGPCKGLICGSYEGDYQALAPSRV